ncbi:MAG: MerR family transcriptional regulator [Parvibaculum sp.]|uniref:MerR family transcriptional regulator n=1 Tax=Parvibaculum sp. TaxID=2024848 RepID=UPI0032EB1E2A
MARDFHIGEFAARTGRSIDTIRWYEKQGLIPGVARDAGGRRVYADHHVAWLDLIDRLRRTGMSVAQLREYTSLTRQGKAALKDRRALLAAHGERVRETIADWTAALALIDAKVDFYGEWMAKGTRPTVAPHHRAAVPAKVPKKRRA